MESLFVGILLSADIITNVMVRNHYNIKFLKGYGFSISVTKYPFSGSIIGDTCVYIIVSS